MIDYTYLRLQNPWWENKEAINEDEKIKEFDYLRFRYQPQKILDLPLRWGDIHLITGPRQTGKSMALKLYLHQLFKSGFPSEQTLFFSCDALSAGKEIIDLMIEFRELVQDKQVVIFLDEVSSVEGWPLAVKWLVDSGLAKKAVFFLTGSSSINLKKSGEFLPGRRGKGKDIVYLPIGFFDYLKLRGERVEKIDLWKKNPLPKLAQTAARIKPYYRQFLLSGGFLRNINYGLTETANDLYLKTLRSELFKAGKKEDSLREVIRKILSSLSSQTSYTNIAEEAELGSKNTAIDYLSFLADSFFLNEVKFYDPRAKRIILKKNKKFYSTDPYLLWLFEGFVYGTSNFTSFTKLFVSFSEQSKLAENFVATELGKTGRKFYFFQNSRELDFYLPEENLGVEVKYKQKITGEDLRPLSSVARKILVSKDTLGKRGDVFIIPVYLFPLCLTEI